MLHAVFGAQPLLVLRPTGPITAITIKLSDIADHLGLDFFQYLCATGIGHWALGIGHWALGIGH